MRWRMRSMQKAYGNGLLDEAEGVLMPPYYDLPTLLWACGCVAGIIIGLIAIGRVM